MVAEQIDGVPVDRTVRAWLRDVLDVPVFFGVNNDADFPQVVVMRIDGPDDAARFQFDVWGGSKDAAEDTAVALAGVLSAARFEAEGGRLLSADHLATRWFPDPETDRPRYIVEALATVTPTA